MKKIGLLITSLVVGGVVRADDNDYARSVFVPRQLSYNPILENALDLNAKKFEENKYFMSIKPIYTQSVGDKLDKYFNICHKECLAVREDGSGDIDSLWFEVISTDSTFYSSTLTFEPKRQTYGALFYAAAQLPKNFEINLNMAVVGARNDMNICEQCIENLGTVTGYATVTQSFYNKDRCYGRICGDHHKAGVDDIQIKLMYHAYDKERSKFDVYGLLGIPTGKGTEAVNVFEPLVGSKHFQVGLGAYGIYEAHEYASGSLKLFAEAKWRYAFKAHEDRSFDLCPNGQWSRYLLFVQEDALNVTFPAINKLTLKSDVTPGNSFDLYLAMHANHNAFQFELGYDLWYRSEEKVCVDCECANLTGYGVADLVGIAALSPHSASKATVSQAVQPGINQAPSDSTFVAVTLNDLNLDSAAAPRSISNSFYASLAYAYDCCNHPMLAGVSVAYEHGSGVNVPDNVTIWAGLSMAF